jgi:hypothetical protein
MPPRRRRWPVWVTLGLVAVLLLCVAPAAFVVSKLPLAPGERGSATQPGDARGVSSPGPNAPLRDRLPWVRQQISTALEAQTKALLSGDQRGFVAPADPKARKLAGELVQRFGSLRALKVAQYNQRIVSGPTRTTGSGGRNEWKVRIQLLHCFVVANCVPDPVLIDSQWVETASGVRMATLGASRGDDNGPRPWEVSSLKAVVGARTVVATTSGYASRLPSMLKEAEKAAANADLFVLGDKKPDRYRIFLAGPSEWKKWYGGDLPKWSVGFATNVSDDRMEVVLNVNEIESDFLDEVLRHELGHVATLAAHSYQHEGNFWLIEGIAEYIQENGRPVDQYDGRFVVRRYLREGGWDGKVDVPPPTASTPDWQVGARYGISYYSVRRMSERFGRKKMIQFFSEVIHQGSSLTAAAQAAYGVSWANVNADCARYVRARAG